MYLRREDFRVGFVHAIRRSYIKHVADNECRTTGGIVGKDTQLIDQVEAPDNVTVLFVQLDRCFAGPGHVLCFIHEGTIVSISLTLRIQAYYLVGAGHNIDTISIDSRR